MNLFKLNKLLIAFFIIILVVPKIVNATGNFVDGFDYPIAKPDALGFYDAQDFGVYNKDFRQFHLGEDWNKKCSYDCDLNESVYAIANGKVRLNGFFRGWGNVVIVEHEFANGKKVYSLYGHLINVRVSINQSIKRGDLMGGMSKGDRGQYWAHLHFEIRTDDNPQKLSEGFGYSATPKPAGWLDPSDFIDANRPLSSVPISLQASNQTGNSLTLTWNKPTFANFDRYELYRSAAQGGTADPSKRTNLLLNDDKNNIEKTSFIDTNLTPDTPYFYSLYAYAKNGLYIKSEEIGTKTGTGVKNITKNPFMQKTPRLNDRYVVWEDDRLDENRRRIAELFGYDLLEDKEFHFPVAITGSDAPLTPAVYGGKVVYSARKYRNYNSDTNIYLYDIVKQSGFAVTSAPGYQYFPQIHKNMVVWEDHNRLATQKIIDICYLDLDDGFTGPVCLDLGPNLHVYPSIWEKKIVFVDVVQGVVGKDVVKVYDIETKQTTVLPGLYKEARPMISDGKVIFSDFSRDLYVYDLNTQSLNKYAKYVFRSIIKEGKIIYFTWENNLGAIRLFDPIIGNEKSLVSGLKYLNYFDYENGVLVYADQDPEDQYVNLDVFLVKG